VVEHLEEVAKEYTYIHICCIDIFMHMYMVAKKLRRLLKNIEEVATKYEYIYVYIYISCMFIYTSIYSYEEVAKKLRLFATA